MIPTFWGRVQTRFLLYLVIALPVTLIYALFLTGWRWPPRSVPFAFVTALLLGGWILDFFYIQIQRFRWDNDWPFAFQFIASFFEFFLVFGMVKLGWLEPWIPAFLPFVTALFHFLWVFTPSFLALLGGAQIFLIRWRFKGGELGRMNS
jgi:hypothetical protein